ncbi:MAG: stalk domain-containing protein, partial [Nitrososphaeria archaeon]
YYGIMWSTNNGKDWSLTNLTSSEFFSVTFSKANPKYVFAGGYGGLYMSKDSGYNFSRILYNFEVPIYSVVAPSSQSIFVLTKSYIYKSDDLGKTFTIINDKVKNLNPTVLAGDFNDPNVFYLGTTNGLYISKDSCLTFEPFGDLKPNTFIYSIVSLKDGTIYIGTDSGVYRGIIATDNNPPQIVISSPIDNATVTSPVLRIVGNVSDSESGVYKLTVNGLEVQFDTNGNFVYDLSLASGLNNIEVRAFDKAGNVSTKILSISYKKTVILTLFIGSDKLTTSDGEIIKLDSPPVIVEGRTLVPIRPIIEKLGGTISWTASEQKVTIILGNKTLELWIGKPQARVNGALVWIDPNNTKVVPLIINGRTMLPVRFVSEQLGAKVDWDAGLKKITITYPGP